MMPGLRQKLIVAYSRPGEIGAELADAGGLGVADAVLAADDAALVELDDAFVAAALVDHRRGVFVVRDVADEHRVGVLLQRLVVRPDLLAGAVPQRVADGQAGRGRSSGSA